MEAIAFLVTLYDADGRPCLQRFVRLEEPVGFQMLSALTESLDNPQEFFRYVSNDLKDHCKARLYDIVCVQSLRLGRAIWEKIPEKYREDLIEGVIVSVQIGDIAWFVGPVSTI